MPSDSTRRVALVFDDGPIEACTPLLLAVLSRNDTSVTFAYIGANAAGRPELVRAAHRAGHELINHSFTHPRFTSIDDVAVHREIVDTQAAIHELTGVAPKWFWSPFGDWDERVAAAVATVGLHHYPIQLFHFVSTNDWQPSTSAEAIRHSATTHIRDRTVILFHEWRQETLAQMPVILAELKSQGCTFVTFTELTEAS